MLLPGEGPCVRPKGVDMHFEVELALVIGKLVRDLKPSDLQGAMDAIQGTKKNCSLTCSTSCQKTRRIWLTEKMLTSSVRRGH